jgi:hypothetical protein
VNTSTIVDVLPAPPLEARVAQLEARVALLERAGHPRDRADAALRRQLAASTRGLAFRAADLLRHGHVDEALARALAEADLVTSADVGCWLRDRAGLQDGIAIVRLRGRHWQVRHMTCAA